MKTKFLILIISVLSIKTHAENIVVPDANFKAYLLENFDIDKNGEISKQEAELVAKISCNNKNIKSLDGVRAFVNLEILDCRDNQIQKVDLSNNKKLKALLIDSNQLIDLNLSQNSNLQLLSCTNNQLTSLNVANNKEIISLACGANQLKSLDVSENEKLKELFFAENEIAEINLHNNLNLEILSCSANKLEELNLTHNHQLKRLICQDNQLKNLDLSENIKLEWLRSDSGNPDLKCIRKNSKLHTAHTAVNKPFCK